MHEIRIHGRGGQGAGMAGGILASALVLEGKFVVAVPSFGFERRGAPVASFLRLGDRGIRQMTNIYNPHCILLGALARTTGLVTLESLRAAIKESEFRDAGLEQNLAALERGYYATQV